MRSKSFPPVSLLLTAVSFVWWSTVAVVKRIIGLLLGVATALPSVTAGNWAPFERRTLSLWPRGADNEHKRDSTLMFFASQLIVFMVEHKKKPICLKEKNLSAEAKTSEKFCEKQPRLKQSTENKVNDHTTRFLQNFPLGPSRTSFVKYVFKTRANLFFFQLIVPKNKLRKEVKKIVASTCMYLLPARMSVEIAITSAANPRIIG